MDINQLALKFYYPSLFDDILGTLQKCAISDWRVTSALVLHHPKKAEAFWAVSLTDLENNVEWLRINEEEKLRSGLLSALITAMSDTRSIRTDTFNVLVLGISSILVRYIINDAENVLSFQFEMSYELQLGVPPIK